MKQPAIHKLRIERVTINCHPRHKNSIITEYQSNGYKITDNYQLEKTVHVLCFEKIIK
jgi:hypothetical protein